MFDWLANQWNEVSKSIGFITNFFSPGGGAAHVSPEKNEVIVKFFETLSPYLHTSDPFSYGARKLGWWIISLLAGLNSMLNDALSAMLKYINIWQKLGDEYLPYLKPYGNFFLLLAIIGMGYLLYRGKVQEAGNTPFNILAVTIVMLIVPTIMPTIFDTIKPSQQTLTATKGTPADNVIQSNITDLYKFGKVEWDPTKVEGDKGNDIKAGKIQYVDPNEYIKDSKNVKNGGFLDNEIAVNTSGSVTWVKMDHGSLASLAPLFGHYYYRYSIHFWVIIFSLLATDLAGILLLIRFARVIYGIATDWIFSPLVAYTHAHSDGMQAAKMVLMAFLSGGVTILAMFYGWYIYGTAIGLVSSESNLIARLALIYGFTWGLLDTPAILQKAFGIDAGLKSTMGAVMTGAFAAKGAQALGKKGIDAGVGVAETGLFAGGFLKGLGQGPSKSLGQELAQKKKTDSGQDDPKNPKGPNGPKGPKGSDDDGPNGGGPNGGPKGPNPPDDPDKKPDDKGPENPDTDTENQTPGDLPDEGLDSDLYDEMQRAHGDEDDQDTPPDPDTPPESAEPTPNVNPVKSAVDRYLDTPKSARKGETAHKRLTGAWRSGQQIGSDFDRYNQMKTKQARKNAKDRDFLRDFDKYRKH